MRRESVKEAYGCVPPMNTRSLERRDEMLIWIPLGCDVDHSVDKALRCSGSEQELDLVLKVFGHKKAPLMAGFDWCEGLPRDLWRRFNAPQAFLIPAPSFAANNALCTRALSFIGHLTCACSAFEFLIEVGITVLKLFC